MFLLNRRLWVCLCRQTFYFSFLRHLDQSTEKTLNLSEVISPSVLNYSSEAAPVTKIPTGPVKQNIVITQPIQRKVNVNLSRPGRREYLLQQFFKQQEMLKNFKQINKILEDDVKLLSHGLVVFGSLAKSKWKIKNFNVTFALGFKVKSRHFFGNPAAP